MDFLCVRSKDGQSQSHYLLALQNLALPKEPNHYNFTVKMNSDVSAGKANVELSICVTFSFHCVTCCAIFLFVQSHLS